MAEYKFEDLIMNPEDQSLEGLIGKEVYCSDVPLSCLMYANNNCDFGILKEIHKDNTYPFRVKTSEGHILSYICIIPKKEEPNTEYVPFKNQEEFVRTHQKIKESFKYDTFENNLANYGIWLKHKHTKSCSMVIKIENNGVILGDLRSADWRELFAYYTFIEGTPCGKYMEDSND